MLKVKDLEVYYGNVHALRGVSLRVDDGELVTVIGSNGAGKTTLLRTISGLLTPRSGAIRYRGSPIQGRQTHEIVGLGIGHCPEGRHLFSPLTVMENLKMGAFQADDGEKLKANLARVFDLFPLLQERKAQRAGTLSGGEQQMLAIGRSLMGEPRLLLLDEPSLGLAPMLVKRIFDVLGELKQAEVTVLLVEQNARMALSLADRGYVLETGSLVMEGTGEALREDESVVSAYLGGESQ